MQYLYVKIMVLFYILLRFGGGVSRGLEEALEELSILCLVGLLGILFKSSRLDSESFRSFFTFDAKRKHEYDHLSIELHNHE